MSETGPTGSIQRAKAVLDVLSEATLGATLSQVIAGTDFTKTTTHRTLQSLQAVNYVYQEPDSRRYFLGSALARLARRANQADISSLAGRSMRRLAEQSQDTIFLSVPEGAEAVCVRVELGAFQIRTLSLSVGQRTPLGVGSTGQALYAATPKAKREAALKTNENWIPEFNFTRELVETHYALFKEKGYAINPGIAIPGMVGIGMPFLTSSGRLIGAFGIGAIRDRMSTERIEGELVPLLREETDRMRERLDELEKVDLL